MDGRGSNENNRKENLTLLKEFLNKVVVKFPDIEFMSANELHNVMIKNT